MTLIRDDRVAETSTTTGTGALTLAAAITGFRRFSAVMTSPSDTCYYEIEGVDANGIPTGEWETGLGTYSAANTLTRATVHKSSNANAAVAFSAGTKRVAISETLAALLTRGYNYGGFAVAAITASEILMDHIVTEAHTLSANLAGSQVKVGTNPTASWVGDLQKNGTTCGTVTISTAGVATLTTPSGAAQSVAVGDVMTLVGPASADATIARLRFTFRGIR